MDDMPAAPAADGGGTVAPEPLCDWEPTAGLLLPVGRGPCFRQQIAPPGFRSGLQFWGPRSRHPKPPPTTHCPPAAAQASGPLGPHPPAQATMSRTQTRWLVAARPCARVSQPDVANFMTYLVKQSLSQTSRSLRLQRAGPGQIYSGTERATFSGDDDRAGPSRRHPRVRTQVAWQMLAIGSGCSDLD